MTSQKNLDYDVSVGCWRKIFVNILESEENFCHCFLSFFVTFFDKIAALIDRVQQLYANVVANVMDSVFDSYFVQDGTIDPNDINDDIPKTNDFVWILGKKYNALQGFCF